MALLARLPLVCANPLRYYGRDGKDGGLNNAHLLGLLRLAGESTRAFRTRDQMIRRLCEIHGIDLPTPEGTPARSETDARRRSVRRLRRRKWRDYRDYSNRFFRDKQRRDGGSRVLLELDRLARLVVEVQEEGDDPVMSEDPSL